MSLPSNLDVGQMIQQLKRDEGQKSKPYVDTAGKITIGVGRNLTDDGIRDNEINFMLQNDIVEATDSLLEHLPWTANLDAARFGVLVNMCFNMGIAGLLAFTTTLGYFKTGSYQAAADAMLNSKWASEVGARAQRLAKQARTGVWQ